MTGPSDKPSVDPWRLVQVQTRTIADLTAEVSELRATVKELTGKLDELTREANKNSRNSSKPPSSDKLSQRSKIRKPKKRTGRKKGGQPGHKGHSRELLPADAVDLIRDMFPGECEICQQTPPPQTTANPRRHQVVELLDNGCPHVTEYRMHSYDCACGAELPASDENVPKSAFGPRLKCFVASLTGEYNLSRRQVPALLDDVFGIKMSLGSVSNIEGQVTDSLQPAFDQAEDAVLAASEKHIDETGWIRDFERRSAWVIASAALTVFRIVKDGRRETLRKILGKQLVGVLISDRATVFRFWPMAQRQICWSHLLRKFVDFSERDPPAAQLGADLVVCAELVLGYWRGLQSGTISRARFEEWMEAVKRTTKWLLDKGVAANIDVVSGSCANMLEHWDAMWTFVGTPGVDPTNNHAERELRRLVMWRKRCFGSQSDRGEKFVERMLTVTHSLRKQGRRVLPFLYEAFCAMLNGTKSPQLAPTT